MILAKVIGTVVADARASTLGGQLLRLVQMLDGRTLEPKGGIYVAADVTGAGDTVIALVTLGAAAKGDLFDTARLANYGAGVVVRKWGNAVLRLEELRAAIREG